MSNSEDEDSLDAWARRWRLPDETVNFLNTEGYRSLSDLAYLSSQCVTESFQRPRLLPHRDCQMLIRALDELKVADTPGGRRTDRDRPGDTVTSRKGLHKSKPSPGASCQKPSPSSAKPQWKKHYKLLLVGKRQSGKSSTANTILSDTFFSESTNTGRSTLLKFERDTPFGKIMVVECPSPKSRERFASLLRQGYELKPDAVVYVVKQLEFDDKDHIVYDQMMTFFGRSACPVIVLFTHAEKINQQDAIDGAPAPLKEIIKDCCKRCVSFNNKAKGRQSQKQVEKLMDIVDRLKKQREVERAASHPQTRTPQAATPRRRNSKTQHQYEYEEEGNVEEKEEEEEEEEDEDEERCTKANGRRRNKMKRDEEEDDESEKEDNGEEEGEEDIDLRRNPEGPRRGVPVRQAHPRPGFSGARAPSAPKSKVRGQEHKQKPGAPDINININCDLPFQTASFEEEKVQFLLFGKTGSGKSTTGNTILGEEMFETSPEFASVTFKCDRKSAWRGNTRIEIMDSPGLFDTTKSQKDIGTLIIKSVAGLHPGAHAVLYVVMAGRYTEEEFGVYQRLKVVFDDEIIKYTIVIIAGADKFERKGKTIDDYLKNAPDNLRTVLRECEQRYIAFNNFANDPKPQVDRLLQMVREMVAKNGGTPYVCQKYLGVGVNIEKLVTERMESFEAEEIKKREAFMKQFEAKQKEILEKQDDLARQLRENKISEDAAEKQRLENDKNFREHEDKLDKMIADSKKKTEDETKRVLETAKDDYVNSKDSVMKGIKMIGNAIWGGIFG